MEKDLNNWAHVIQLPEAVQEEIRAEVTAALLAEGMYSEEAVQDAMDSKVIDLEEVLDPEKYAPQYPALRMEM